MSRRHFRKSRPKKEKPEAAPVVEVQPPRGETIKATHGGYTHKWGLRYYEYTVWKGEGAK